MLEQIWSQILRTITDVLPIVGILLGFQLLILRQPLRNAPQIFAGFCLVILGLALFLIGLNSALFPLGALMAQQLTSDAFIGAVAGDDSTRTWTAYGWTYVFAFAVGFATTIAEPALIAVALKAEQISGGTIRAKGLRLAVALGVAIGLTLGVLRIVTGTYLAYYIIVGYVLVLIQTIYAPKSIVSLAYDSGGVTTSTVTVPLVAALGIGLATTVPGRNPLYDGFGLIAFASLLPIMAVLGYGQISDYFAKKNRRTRNKHHLLRYPKFY